MPNGYNFIFRDLVLNEDDFVGMVAYSIYKRQKIEWIEKFKAENNGRDPNDQEVEAAFTSVSNLPSQVQSYREEAISLLDAFLEAALEQKLDEGRKLIRDDAIVKAVSKGFLKSVGENLVSGIAASLLTIAAAAIIWAAAKGPEALMREALSHYLQQQPEQIKPLP